MAEYTEAIRLDPNYARAYDSRANAYGIKKDYDKAIDDCTKAIQIDPKYARAYSHPGRRLRGRGPFG